MSDTRTIEVGYLARVEGEGSLKAEVIDGELGDIEFNIFEPPRFFEGFLRGRGFTEAPDITARICGICPIAYQISSVRAMEDVCGVAVAGALNELRRLIYCGEYIESHALHIYLLHAPDFLGYDSGIAMAADHRAVVERGLRLKQTGNELVRVLGGREIHPVNVRVGGFWRLPSRAELQGLATELDRARDEALETVKWVSQLNIPQINRPVEFVALSDPDRYSFFEGRIKSTKGIDIEVSEWNDVFVEEHVQRSNALHSRVRERGMFAVGPTARFALNHETIQPSAAKAAAEAGLEPGVANPFESIIVRAVETLHAVEEALAIIDAYDPPAEASLVVEPVAGVGHGASEAPRGLLYHRYEIDDTGAIIEAQLVPPTSQNQLSIEADVREVLRANLDRPDDELRWILEQSIRNYDPCISCATHFLRLEVNRG
jgi:coenzyme F420-reducing hydrogenase alpha subunit